MITDDDLKKAIDRIARTPDGELLYRYFQQTLMGVVSSEQKMGALRENLGARRFASTLMGLMARGIEESGARTDSSGKRTERPVVFVRSQPVAVNRRESGREWLTRTDPELARIAATNGSGDRNS